MKQSTKKFVFKKKKIYYIRLHLQKNLYFLQIFKAFPNLFKNRTNIVIVGEQIMHPFKLKVNKELKNIS